MIPLRDVIPSRTTPWVSLVFIVLNAAVVVYQHLLPDDQRVAWLLARGLVPAQFSWTDATTSLFVHQNLVHVSANLWAFWLFGATVEDRLGHGRYLLLLLIAGYVAAFAQVRTTPNSLPPLVGASGAVAGIIGAYFMLFPRSRVLVLVPAMAIFDIVELPAVLFLGVWWLLQIVAAAGDPIGPPARLVLAWWSPLAGLVTGVTLVWILKRPERLRVEWWGA